MMDGMSGNTTPIRTGGERDQAAASAAQAAVGRMEQLMGIGGTFATSEEFTAAQRQNDANDLKENDIKNEKEIEDLEKERMQLAVGLREAQERYEEKIRVITQRQERLRVEAEVKAVGELPPGLPSDASRVPLPMSPSSAMGQTLRDRRVNSPQQSPPVRPATQTHFNVATSENGQTNPHMMDLVQVLTARIESMSEEMNNMKYLMANAASAARAPSAPDAGRGYGDAGRGYGGQSMSGVGRPAPIDKKIADKPTKYSGNPLEFVEWQRIFKIFLESQDPRWVNILNVIEERSTTPLFTTEHFMQVAKDADIDEYLTEFQKLLYQYLDIYTKGDAKKIVAANAANKSFESWRYFADKGRSRRPEHVYHLRKAVHNPKAATKLADVEGSIATWEANREHFERVAAPDVVSEGDAVMILMHLCPKELKEHLEKEQKNMKSSIAGEYYNNVKMEIFEWVARVEGPTLPHGALAEISEVRGARYRDELKDDEDDDYEEVELSGQDTQDVQTLLAAMVRKTGLKVRPAKGGGKSFGKDGAQARVKKPMEEIQCHGCGEFGHFVRDCPHKADGGKGKGTDAGSGKGADKGKGKYGKSQWNPTKSWWMHQYPGPSKGQWGDWYPGKSKGKGQGGGQAIGPPRLTALQELQQAGNIFSFVECKPNADKSKAPPMKHKPHINIVNDKKHVSMKRVKKWKPLDFKYLMEDDAEDDDEVDEKNEDEKLEGDMRSVRSGPAPTASPEPLESGLMRCSPKRRPNSKEEICHKCQPHGAWQPMPQSAGKKVLNLFAKVSSIAGGLNEFARADTDKWEQIEAVVDSGATVPVLSPTMAKLYKVEPSEASLAGVEYEVANGERLANLGQKVMAVYTEEGTLRGMTAQVADVSKMLMSVRHLCKSGHAVVFDEDGSMIINKTTGEVNKIADDGVNYLMKLWAVPPDELADYMNPDFTGQHP